MRTRHTCAFLGFLPAWRRFRFLAVTAITAPCVWAATVTATAGFVRLRRCAIFPAPGTVTRTGLVGTS